VQPSPQLIARHSDAEKMIAEIKKKRAVTHIGLVPSSMLSPFNPNGNYPERSKPPEG
jgi:hypothetical protein